MEVVVTMYILKHKGTQLEKKEKKPELYWGYR